MPDTPTPGEEIKAVQMSRAMRDVVAGIACDKPCLHAECVAARMLTTAYDAAVSDDALAAREATHE